MQDNPNPDTTLTELILATFRLNGALLQAGDALVRDLGLTSARWQVLGALALEGRPLTVAQIGRRMGLTRQAVQRLVTELSGDGLLVQTDNPDHKRARLVALSARGETLYARAEARQQAWVRPLAQGLDPAGVEAAARLLRGLDERLRSGEAAADQSGASRAKRAP